MDAGDLLRPVGPVIGHLAKAMQRLTGADTVSEPVRMDPLVRLPGKPPLSHIDRERVEEFATKVVDQLAEFREKEFARLAVGEWNAAVEAVQETLRRSAPLDVGIALEADLDAERLARKLIDNDPDRVRTEELVDDALDAYHVVLLACSMHLVEFFSSRPSFSARVDVELIRRTGDIGRALADRVVPSEFEARYREAVVGKLRKLRLFGVRLGRIQSQYPLSTAYISLSGTPEISRSVDLTEPRAERTAEVQPDVKVRLSRVLATHPRLLVRGEAGSGKTTLLQWIATMVASGSAEVPELTGKVPFFIRLRNFAGRPLPVVDQFVEQISSDLALDAPVGWVRSVLRDRRALVLVDGVDELPEDQRPAVQEWLDDLTTQFTGNHCVVTSRPPAASANWLVDAEFRSFRILPMDMSDIDDFIAHWHGTMRDLAESADDADEVTRLQSDLQRTLGKRRDLRKLATNPLLCALICALHLDRLRELPRDRMELYRAALEMLLSERDRQRHVPTFIDEIARRDQEMLLAHLAYWMIRNNRLDVTREEVEKRIDHERRGMHQLKATSAELAEYLVLRSGVLQMVSTQRADFLHRTFQEYLAAQAVLDLDDIDFLLEHAEKDQWREVVPMVVGHANRRERERIINGLIERGDRDRKLKYRLHLLAATCLDNASYLSQDTAALVRQRTELMIPPTSSQRAKALIRAGDLVLDLVPSLESLGPVVLRRMLLVVQGIGGVEALPVLSRFAALPDLDIRKRLARAWPDCDAGDYARTVLHSMDLTDVMVWTGTNEQVKSLKHVDSLTSLCISSDRPSDPVLLNNLGHHPRLHTLKLVDVVCANGLHDLARIPLRQLDLHGMPLTDTESLLMLPSVEKLTIGPLVIDEEADPTNLGPTVRHLRLVGAGNPMDAYESAAVRSVPATWQRPTLTALRGGEGIRHLSLVGWPSQAELDVIRTMPALESLHILIADDLLRERLLKGDPSLYRHPSLLVGLAQIAGQVPSGVELHLGVFSPSPSLPAIHCEMRWHDHAYAEATRSVLTDLGHRGTVFVNGVAINHRARPA